MPNTIELFNLVENDSIVSPCITVHGKLSKSDSARNIQVQHPQLPPLSFPVNEGFFKATILLTPGENRLMFVTDTNVSCTVTCHYTPLVQNKPVHLCLIIAEDSPLKFDSPASQIAKEGGNGVDLAIKKLRIAGRLMQSFTNEQMQRNGFGQRTFNFVEEWAHDTQFRNGGCPMRNTIKIHVVRSERTTSEIRDHNVAQQNSKGTNTGALFGWAMDALKKYGGPFQENEHPVQAACVFLDSHWDGKLITGHAALGGGDDHIKLAIFGSHGIYSWPTCMEDIIPYFLDETKRTNEVANDCNECGSHWECAVVTMGAFMHEIGHLLGCPHQEHGVMLRDYTRLNRSFLTREAFATRTNSYGAKPPIFPKEECTWHRLDLVRFLYHPSFTKEQDFYDSSFMRPTRNGGFKVAKPALYPLNNDMCRITSSTGIYLIEIICGDLAKAFIEYLPKSLGGTGPQREVILSLADLQSRIPKDKVAEYGNKFKLKVLAVNSPDVSFDNFPALLLQALIPMTKYGYSQNVQGIKSQLLGSSNRGKDIGIIAVDMKKVVAVRVYHGYALDGIRFYLTATEPKDKDNGKPAVPPRTYMGKLTNAFKSTGIKEDQKSVLFGNQTPNYTDIVLEPNEIIKGFNVRCGAWIDAVQLVTNNGRMTKMCGNITGGGLAELIPPEGQSILGLYGNVGKWVDAIGIVYGNA
ncbi:hypothetical protein KAFR_0J01500 [Kazachstania africana CBS 2517]|uniref:Jacalin-type lectin domain-containing protein n=1 Tax=Kazachstania africana (strain ATCC 22294 / BCRC 22015 / CBS 2517 / CECT 1963 / NBRC 1671 / NRRL Y-8276) TaxID=1071382 RepID=H2B0R6_KAZAF|nr:hypothetical protein KAFR_0J01500 [Kazachstania africana CBS 2517]CCF60216.1 hypothetical protein KAFR_0J01500 [Kazachstania africana CBS 2517]